MRPRIYRRSYCGRLAGKPVDNRIYALAGELLADACEAHAIEMKTVDQEALARLIQDEAESFIDYLRPEGRD